MLLLDRGNDSDNEEAKITVEAVIKAMPIAEQRSVIQIAAKYGLKWSIIKELIASNIDEVVNRHHSLTGLRLFMVAAMGNEGCSHDLSYIYSLMRMSPSS